MNPMLTLLSANLSSNIVGNVSDALGGFVVVIIFGAAVVGIIRLILGVIRAAKTPPSPPVKGNLEIGNWGEGSYEGSMYGDGVGSNDWNWHDSGSHSSTDFSTSDGGGGCDAGGFDGGGGDSSCD
jgi:hypothetical protein